MHDKHDEKNIILFLEYKKLRIVNNDKLPV